MKRGDFWTLVLLGLALAWWALQQSSSPPPAPATNSDFDPATPEDLDNVTTGQPIDATWSVQTLAQAIATAEGFGIADAIPTRANNPGDLVGWGNYPTLGEGISAFPDVQTGWNALYTQLNKIANGTSTVYSVNMTIPQMASRWTATQKDAWTNNVITNLNDSGISCDASTTLAEIFANG